MTLDGYRVIENEIESRQLLTKFYEQKGINIVTINQPDTSESTVPASTHAQTSKQI